MNANAGEIRRRAAFEQSRRPQSRRPRGPFRWPSPAPIQETPREELLRLALACEAHWDKLKRGPNAEKSRIATDRS